MSDDFGTVNTRRTERAREIDRLRQHYKNHRDTLSGLMGDAPSEHLANEYQRLISDIDTAVRKLEELEGRAGAAAPAPNRPMASQSGLGARPLVRPEMPAMTIGSKPQSQTAIVVIALLILIGVTGYAGVRWWRSSHRKRQPTIVEQPITATQSTSTGPTLISAASPPSSLKITPALADYGTIRKGTRAVRQFELVNTSNGPVDIQVARSACRCLFYDYKSKIAGNAKETITVTIDGARAKPGQLQENVEVTSKGDPSVSTRFAVQAMVR